MGVARQYCGQGQAGELPDRGEPFRGDPPGEPAGGYRLYLPKDWANDPVRRTKAGVPDDVTCRTKPEIALQQMRQARADGVPAAVVLADPAYGNNCKFRAGITELEMPYAVGIIPATMVWRPGLPLMGTDPLLLKESDPASAHRFVVSWAKSSDTRSAS